MNRKKTSGKKFSKFGYTPREVVFFFGNFGKCCSICYWKLPQIQSGHLVEWKEPKVFVRISLRIMAALVKRANKPRLGH